MALVSKEFPLPDTNYAYNLLKIDKCIDKLDAVIGSVSVDEKTSERLDALLDKSAEYELRKEALLNQINQQVVPVVVPEEILTIPHKVEFDQYSNAFIVTYDEDMVSIDNEEESTMVEEDVPEPVEEESEDIPEPIENENEEA